MPRVNDVFSITYLETQYNSSLPAVAILGFFIPSYKATDSNRSIVNNIVYLMLLGFLNFRLMGYLIGL